MSLQIVYVLTNPAMPGLVKIGSTAQEEVDGRMRQLFSAGVPVPFECVFACRVQDAHKVERALHVAFQDQRVNQTREFFKIEADRVVAILKLLHTDEVTEEVERSIESEATPADIEAGRNLKRRPKMNFLQMGIPVGSILISREGASEATVCTDKLVMFDGAQSSLTAATRKMLGLKHDYVLQPSPYWTFQGKSLKQIYEGVYSEEG